MRSHILPPSEMKSLYGSMIRSPVVSFSNFRSAMRFLLCAGIGASLPRNSPLSCRSFDNFESKLGGLPLQMLNLELPVLSFVERSSSVYVFHPVAQYAVDQAGQLGGHGLDRNGSTQLGSQSAELRSKISIA